MSNPDNRVEAPGDAILQEDLEILADGLADVRALDGAAVLVTGATGFLGSLLVKALLCHARRNKTGTRVVGLARSRRKAEDVLGGVTERRDLTMAYADLSDSFPVTAGPVDYVFHTAAVTGSRQMVAEPVETIRGAVNGTDNTLAYAAGCGARGVVYLSSMEVYGSFPAGKGLVAEDELGFVDLAQIRSGYPESKRLCELLCRAYAAEYGLDVKIARLAQTFGAGVSATESRVFAQFARQAMAGKDIVLHTDGSSEGNYCYSRDAVAALFAILFRGASGEAYNVANEGSHRTILEMAELVAREIAGGSIRVVVDLPADANALGYAPKTLLHLSSEKLRGLGWRPEVDLRASFERMIGSMRATA